MVMMDVGAATRLESLPAISYLPGAWLDLDVAPPPRWPIAHRNVRAVHGLLTALLGLSHALGNPLFALAPWPTGPTGLGWAAYVYDLDHALRCAGQTTCGDLFGKPTIVRCSGARRVSAPRAGSGLRTIEIRTVTPVCLRRTDNAGKKRFRLSLDDESLRMNLVSWLVSRLRISPPDSGVGVRIITNEIRVESVPIGGKLGMVVGLGGRLVVEVDSWALWILRAAEVLGLGGRVGYGFGRIIVRG